MSDTSSIVESKLTTDSETNIDEEVKEEVGELPGEAKRPNSSEMQPKVVEKRTSGLSDGL